MSHEFTFGQWVKEQRKILDLTQRTLASRIGCSLSAIQKIETDRRRPSRQMAELFAEHLGIAPGEQNAFIRLARSKPGVAESIAVAAHLYHQPFDNLPAPLTPLIGREWDVETVCAALLRDEVRLLTLSGSPGVGKTRLAIQIARTLVNRFSDGVCFVTLAPIVEERFIAPIIIQTLEISAAERRRPLEHLKTFLKNKHLLLVLDNFEHVLAGALQVSELLESAPRLKILVTSRERLQIYGEHEFVVQPLAIPSLEQLPDVEALASYPAVELFVQRARASNLEFVFSTQHAPYVVKVCKVLDGLPLAIELAAARSKKLNPAALLDRLAGAESHDTVRLDSLLAGPTNLPTRQQTLHAAITWSYDLLAPTEQRVFRGMGVFAGGCMAEALSAVCGQQLPPNDPQHVRRWLLTTVHTLVNKSLVVQQTSMGDKSRFLLLEVIRAYALEQLTQNEEISQVRDSHANYFLRLAETVERESRNTDDTEAWALLAVEQDNLRAALRWFLATDNALALRLATTLAQYWNDTERFGETSIWLGRVLAQVEPEWSPCYAYASSRLGVSLWMQGDYRKAQHWFTESSLRWRRLGDGRELGIVVHFLALVLYFRNKYEAALPLAEEAVALLRTSQDMAWIASALNILGLVHITTDNLKQARLELDECLTLFQQLEHEWGVALAWLALTDIPYSQGDYATAHTYIDEALRIYRRLNERWFAAQALLLLGKIHWHLDERAEAMACWEECTALGHDVGAQGFLGSALLLSGFAALDHAEIHLAQSCFDESLTIYRQIEQNAGAGYALGGLAGALIASPDAGVAQCIGAARVLGAVSVLLASRRKLQDEIERDKLLRIEAEIRIRVSAKIYATAWKEGRSWSVTRCQEELNSMSHVA